MFLLSTAGAMYAFHLAANERSGKMEEEREQERQTDGERWPLVLQQEDTSRCRKQTERGKQIIAAFSEDKEP